MTKSVVLCKRRFAFLIIPLLLPAVGFHVADLVTLETLLVLSVSSLTIAFLRPILVLTVFALAVLAFSALALEHEDVHWHNVILIAGPGNGHLCPHGAPDGP